MDPIITPNKKTGAVPVVTVLMPAYNAARFLDESIPSILNQTFDNFEFIIIDDCSTDDTPDIIKKYAEKDPRIVYVRNPINIDHLASRNKALEYARGIYVAELDADDIALPNRLEAQYQYLNQHPEVALVGGWVEIIDSQGIKVGLKQPYESFDLIKYRMLLRNPFTHSAIFYRKDTIRSLGGYNQEYLHAEDYHLYYTLIQNGYRLANVPETIIKYRYHQQSISTVSKTRAIQLASVYQINYRYLNQYLPISLDKVKTVIDTIHKRKQSIFAIVSTILFCKRLTSAYLKKEQADSKYQETIWNIYAKEKEMLLGQSFRTYVPALYAVAKKIYKNLAKWA